MKQRNSLLFLTLGMIMILFKIVDTHMIGLFPCACILISSMSMFCFGWHVKCSETVFLLSLFSGILQTISIRTVWKYSKNLMRILISQQSRMAQMVCLLLTVCGCACSPSLGNSVWTSVLQQGKVLARPSSLPSQLMEACFRKIPGRKFSGR